MSTARVYALRTLFPGLMALADAVRCGARKYPTPEELALWAGDYGLEAYNLRRALDRVIETGSVPDFSFAEDRFLL